MGSDTDKRRQQVGCTRPIKNIVLFHGVEGWLALRVSANRLCRTSGGNDEVPIPVSRLPLTLIVHLCS